MTHPQARSRHDRTLRAAAALLDRRRFLTVTGAAAALAFSTNLPVAGAAQGAEAPPGALAGDPFTLGVASGDPTPSGVVLWTRLAPRPYEPAPGDGLPEARVPVRWEIARDDRFARVVRRGTALAHPEFGHTVHVDVQGLQPDRVYYYRFRVGPWISPPGRT
ncbi:PhoD-like phosphatase N-terminal domain-containing protein, partial [Streptomyces sp. PA03-1a]|nr:PhoD-like phosphatase N-terminal domain-containing protein [Streptomyces sp. PA03-1a]